MRDGRVTIFEVQFTNCGCGTYARGINAPGDIVGEYYYADGTGRGFLRSKE
jgi:hypothetical protein